MNTQAYLKFLKTRRGIVALSAVGIFCGYAFVSLVTGNTFLGVSLNNNPNLEEGLVMHWTFDGVDIDGSTTTDRSGNGNDGLFRENTGSGPTNAWDVSTASYDSVSGSVGTQDTFPHEFAFKPDGTKLYMVGSANDNVFQYSLSSAWDASTISYDSVSFDISGQDSSARGLAFSSDGTQMYYLGGGGSVYQYSLSSAWNVSTASYDSVSFAVSGQVSNAQGIAFSADGSDMYIADGDGYVDQYSLSSAWDLSTASYSSNTAVVGTETSPRDVAFKTDGTKMYVIGASTNGVFQYTLSSAWDVSTESYDSVSFSVSSQEATPLGLQFKTNGTKMYVLGQDSDTVYQYSIGSGDEIAGDITQRPGVVGQAIAFDGVDDYVQGGNVGTGVQTIAFWIKIATTTASHKLIDIDGTDQIEINGSSNVVATSFPSATVYVDGSSASAAITPGWHHVVVTDTTGVNASDVTVGRVGSNYFGGDIDDVRMYDRVLSEIDIERLYGLGATTHIGVTLDVNPELRSGLVGHWTFDGVNIGITTAVGGSATIIGEAGTFSSAADGGWTTVNFDNTYTSPIVVGTANTNNGEGGLIFEARSVTSSSAQMRICESNGGGTDGCDTHSAETAGYVVIDTTAANSLAGIEGGTVSVTDNTDEVVSFSETFGTTPVVLTSVQSDNADPDLPSETWVKSVSTTGVTVEKCHQHNDNSCDGTHSAETVAWLALEPSNLPFGETGEVETFSMSGGGSWSARTFAESYSSAPVAVATAQTQSGAQDPMIDEIRSITTSGMDVRFCELDAKNVCDNHNSETMGWFAVEEGDLTEAGSGGGGGGGTELILDRTASANHGTTTGAISAPGAIGQAYSFDGTDDVIEVDADSSINDLGPVTLAAWVYPRSYGGGGFGRILDKTSGTGPNNGWTFDIVNTQNAFAFAVDYDGVDNFTVRAADNSVTLNTWQHVVVTWDGSSTATNAHIYIDGVEVGSYGLQRDGAGSRNSDAAQTLTIGNDSTGTRGWDGLIDDVRIYDRALPVDQINRLYGLGATTHIGVTLGQQPGESDVPTHHWTFDGPDISGGTTTDIRGGVDGTFTGPTGGGGGGSNVALGQPATASSEQHSSLGPEYAFDGDGGTRWSSASSDPQWIYVDLGSTYSVDQITIDWETAYGEDYDLQVSDDASSWTDIKNVTGENGGTDDHTGLSGTGRYVRMYGTARGTGFGYSIYEMEVYGTEPSTGVLDVAGRPGKIGQAVEFNGSDEYIDVGNIGSAKTIAFWIRADDTTSRKVMDIDGTDQIELNGSGAITATSFPSATVYVDGSSASAAIGSGWHHVAIVDTTGVSASTFEIGRVSTEYFDGLIDDVQVYDAALSTEDIVKLYESGN